MATAKAKTAAPRDTTRASGGKGRAAHDLSAVPLSEKEAAKIEEQIPHRSPVVFEIIRRNGEEEINRPLSSLWWSGLVAGLSIGFSVLTQAMLRGYLPDGGGWDLVAKLGYSVGFVLIILGRHQLFTENVITAVVPVMARDHWKNLLLMLRLWAVVLLANVVGATLFAFFLHHGGAIDPKLARGVHDVASHMMQFPPAEMVARSAVSGFLIACLVWILAGIETGHLPIIVLVTYLIALGDFNHVVAGSVEASYLVLEGTLGAGAAIGGFFVPSLVGNLLGGTVIFTLLSYGQIRAEMK